MCMPLFSLAPPTVALPLCGIRCLCGLKVISDLYFYLFFKLASFCHWFERHHGCHVTFPPFACRQQHNKQSILPLPHLALDHQKNLSSLFSECDQQLNNLLISQRTHLRTWPWSEVTSSCQHEDTVQRIFSLARHCEISCDGKCSF